jgi:hypothetical protein
MPILHKSGEVITIYEDELINVAMPDLFAATQRYWQALDRLEAAYHRGEVSLAEVDARVAELMADLGRERRAALRFLGTAIAQNWREYSTLWLVVGLVLVTYWAGWASLV